MPRNYQLKKRAETQEQTRRRIVEAALALHGEIGPARTTVSAVAQRAGVERHTYYRHFPDERSLFLACSGLHFEINPMPDPEPWMEIENREARLRRGLTELYDYYATNESMIVNVSRDAATHALTAEVQALRTAPHMAAIRATLADGIATDPQQRQASTALDLALAFPTWHTLVRTIGSRSTEAVNLMVRTVLCAAGDSRAPTQEADNPSPTRAPGRAA